MTLERVNELNITASFARMTALAEDLHALTVEGHRSGEVASHYAALNAFVGDAIAELQQLHARIAALIAKRV